MPDASGNIKGISVPRIPWLEEDEETPKGKDLPPEEVHKPETTSQGDQCGSNAR